MISLLLYEGAGSDYDSLAIKMLLNGLRLLRYVSGLSFAVGKLAIVRCWDL